MKELGQVLGILEKIDRGLIHPSMPDRIGRFLHHYRTGRVQLDQVLAGIGVERRTDATVSGRALGTIEVYPVLEPKVSLLGFPLGEVAETLAISEELGALVNVVMWLKGPIANAAYNVVQQSRGFQLSGDYRWTPPARLTPGEAQLVPSDVPIRWRDARCLKAVADDVIRPPHALEYVLDYRMGPPGLKYFRCVCALKSERGFDVLPALGQPRPLEVAQNLREAVAELTAGKLAALLVYREPWSEAWTIVAAVAIGAEEALAHAITWVDFERELDGSETDGAIIAGVRESLRASGVRPADFGDPNLRRSLRPAARHVVRWLRGCG